MPKILDFEPQNAIRSYRLYARLTLQAIADQTSTNPAQIQRLETGKRDLDVDWMRRIAPVLNLRPADLMLEKDGGLSSKERALIDTTRSIPGPKREALISLLTELVSVLNETSPTSPAA
ncbi:MAG: helix-turn-helix transcriptional regulator [Novosphingobium sp.]|nr:helix-turn-helix transcriptional regulator [Novosphingobium sp.]